MKSGRFIKIPNNFFYSDGKILKNIGGRSSFVLYCLITIRKNINDIVYLSISEMNSRIFLDSNSSRGYKKVRRSLSLLREFGFINYSNLDGDIVEIKWINLFPKTSDSGWVKFYYYDFDIFDTVGVDFYCVMWLLRMYTNYELGISYLPMCQISSILMCKTSTVQRAIDFFEYSGLFKVKRGEYHDSKKMEFDKAIKKNNTYKYTGEIKWILSLNTFIK